MSTWPEDARIAALSAWGESDVRLSAGEWMTLAGEFLDAVTPVIAAAERERLAVTVGEWADTYPADSPLRHVYTAAVRALREEAAGTPEREDGQ